LEVASAGDGLELTVDPKPSSKSIRALVAICVGGLLIGAAGLVLPHLLGPRDEFAAERQAVLTRASDFAVTFNTYSSNNKADYQRRVKPLMTTSYYKEFVKITNVMFQVVKDKKQSSGDVKVLSEAVDTIDKDSASAVVAVDAAVHRSDSDQAVARRFRWQISLRKVRGEWLVSEFDSVPPMEATVGDVTSDDKSGGDQ
jgi:Mce-associated membrane protein